MTPSEHSNLPTLALDIEAREVAARALALAEKALSNVEQSEKWYAMRLADTQRTLEGKWDDLTRRLDRDNEAATESRNSINEKLSRIESTWTKILMSVIGFLVIAVVSMGSYIVLHH